MAALPIEAYIDACKAQHEAPVEQVAAALQNEQSLGVSNLKLVRFVAQQTEEVIEAEAGGDEHDPG